MLTESIQVRKHQIQENNAARTLPKAIVSTKIDQKIRFEAHYMLSFFFDQFLVLRPPGDNWMAMLGHGAMFRM